MAEGARLESVYTLTGIVGSNPTLSASMFFVLIHWVAVAPFLSFFQKSHSNLLIFWRSGTVRKFRFERDTRQRCHSWPILSISRLIASLSSLPNGRQMNRLIRRSSMKKAS